MVSPAQSSQILRNGFCCLTCKFFNRTDEGAQTGECRRNAPIGADTYGNGLWPWTSTLDWCGQGTKA